jgi:glucose/arabinose dehydrogenase
MTRFSLATCLVVFAAATAVADESVVIKIVGDLKNPESVCLGQAGKIPSYFVTVIGERDTPGDGYVAKVQAPKAEKFATGLDDPKGIVQSGEAMYVADVTNVKRVDMKGKVTMFAAADAFPIPPVFLNDIEADSAGNLYVSDSGAKEGGTGGLFKITPDGKVTVVVHSSMGAKLQRPNGVLVDGPDHVLLADIMAGDVWRIKLADGSMEKITQGFPGADGLARDYDGNLYLSQWTTGDVSVLRPGAKQWEYVARGFQSAADICLNPRTGQIIVPDMKGGTLSSVSMPSGNPKDADESPLDTVKVEPAWPNLTVDRAIVLTHAGDGSGRTFVASQMGKVYILPKDESASEAQLFFDLEKKVSYKDNENEEGFLGFCFHPKFKENGQFFAYYTLKDADHLSVISRFTVDPKNPDRADASTEQEIMRIPQPFWNHNGGTICFGPDGYLYVGLGDGGKRDDPMGNGQNAATLLGSILRIDVDHHDQGKAYAVPKDNPLVKKKGAAGENFAIGVRNIWRMSFDRKTGRLWAADVGQDIWEEINIVQPGGNYGWNLREGFHQFQAGGSKPRADLLEQVWEYHHDIGKSVTGGHVYRGKKVPELDGKYVYADYVTGKVWALTYDDAKGRVTANREISGSVSPVMSFGEDEAGEVYLLTINGTREGKIGRFVSVK